MKLTAQKTFSIIIINIIFPSISSHSPLLSLFIHPWWKCNDIKKPISFHLPFHSRMNYHLKNIWRLFPLIFIIKERACEWCRKEKIKIYYILQFPLFSFSHEEKETIRKIPFTSLLILTSTSLHFLGSQRRSLIILSFRDEEFFFGKIKFYFCVFV